MIQVSDPTELSLHQTLSALNNREISSVELTDAYLKRIELFEPAIRSFLNLTPEMARKQASRADKTRASVPDHHDLPPLLGIPLAIKDVLALQNVPCTCGSRILENFIPDYTATTVQRLLDAGMIPLGKTNMDEFAMGSSTENSAYHTTHNPWDLKRVPGGSSGGSAAAIAARFAPVALGSDTGGSVRQPASFCGVTGLKPTYGRCSRFGLVAYGSSLDCVGVFGRSVQDVSTIFYQMAGYDPLDSTSLNLPLVAGELTNEANLRGKRVGVPKEYFIEGIQPAVEIAVRKAIHDLEKLGASIHEISLPHTSFALPVYYLIAPAEASANLARFDGIRYGYSAKAERLLDVYKETRGHGFGDEVKRRIMLGTYALSAGYYDAYYGQAQKVRTLIKKDFEEAFKEVDVIATPVAPTTAFEIGERNNDPLAMYLGDIFTLPSNLAGLPGLAFPVGLDEQHLPIGMQILAAPLQEQQLFEVAHAYQLTTHWHHLTPQILTP